MSTTIRLTEYSPSIGDEDDGKKILAEIKSHLATSEEIILDFTGIQTLATICAKLIFGTLFKELGKEQFYNRIMIANSTRTVKRSIKLGIEFSTN